MITSPMQKLCFTFASLTLLAAACSSQAVEIRVTVTNHSMSDSVALSPIIMAAHNGSVDLFSAGMAASAGIEDVSEMGGAAEMLRNEITAAQASAVTEVGIATSGGFGPGVLIPGAEASYVLSLDPTDNRYFSYAAMVVPSNDSFIGNDDPMAVELFDADGNFVASSFELTGLDIWDAGTEVNSLTGAAYIMGQDAALGSDENGLVTQVSNLADQFGLYLGGTTPEGSTFASLPPADAGFVTFSFEAVPEPSTAVLSLMAAGLGLVVWRRRR
ncbi:spondin domain-containing protein [Aeoliella mucimassa]|uniref:Spondin_N n=1 Tax=Aeoliella mucimassa TaxID=2527972 RepID=A0A518AWI0_9BACT|nr:spondin domain-containing protein [Aeoliella mucimassa]QDU59050.1 Spondin_N [Aeoliella mucimassa]